MNGDGPARTGKKLSFWQDFLDFPAASWAFFLSEMRRYDKKEVGRCYLPDLVDF